MHLRHILFFVMLVVGQTILLAQTTEYKQSTSSYQHQGTSSEKALDFYNEGYDAARNNEPQKAKKLYLKAIKEDPRYVEAYDNLGVVCRQLGDYDNAIKYYKKSIEIYPEGNVAHQNLALVYGALGMYDKAIDEYLALRDLSPENPEGYYGLAQTYLGMEKLELAQENAEKCLELYQKYDSKYLADGHYLVGLIYYYQEDRAGAEEHLTQAAAMGINIHPEIKADIMGDGNAAAEAGEELDYELEDPEDYPKYNEEIQNMYSWLLETPVEQDAESRAAIYAFIIQWVSGHPDLMVEIVESVVPYLKCEDCFVMFMGGWANHYIETGTDDKREAALAATRDVIKFYQSNKKELKKNKDLESFIEMENSGKLDSFIKSEMK